VEAPEGHDDGLSDASPDEDLHIAEIRAKRVRYAAEAISPVFGKRARIRRRGRALQDVLGEHQDAVVAQAWPRGGRGPPGAPSWR
jgi:CHAD domain-containing protein